MAAPNTRARRRASKKRPLENKSLDEIVELARTGNVPAFTTLLEEIVNDYALPYDDRKLALQTALNAAIAASQAGIVRVMTSYLMPTHTDAYFLRVEISLQDVATAMKNNDLTLSRLLLSQPTSRTLAFDDRRWVCLPWQYPPELGLWEHQTFVFAIRSLEMVQVVFETLGTTLPYHPSALRFVLEACVLPDASPLGPRMTPGILVRILQLAEPQWLAARAARAAEEKKEAEEDPVAYRDEQVRIFRNNSYWSYMLRDYDVNPEALPDVYMTLMRSPLIQQFFMNRIGANEDLQQLLRNSFPTDVRRRIAPYLIETYLSNDWDWTLRFPNVIQQLERYMRAIVNLLSDALTVTYTAHILSAWTRPAHTLVEFAELLASQPWLPSQAAVAEAAESEVRIFFGRDQFYGLTDAEILALYSLLYRRTALLLRDAVNARTPDNTAWVVPAGAAVRARVGHVVTRLLTRVAEAEPQTLRVVREAGQVTAAEFGLGERGEAIATALVRAEEGEARRELPTDVANLIALMEYGKKNRRRRSR